MINTPVKTYCIIFVAALVFNTAMSQEPPDIAAMIKRAETETDSTRCRTLNKTGNLLNWQGKYDSAALFFRMGLQTAEQVRFIDGQFAALSGLGDVKMNLSQFDSAAYYFTKAKTVAQIEKSPKREATANRAMGAVYMMQGRRERALPYLEEAYRKVLEARDTIATLLICADLGACYGGLGDTLKCLQLFEAGLALCEAATARPAITAMMRSNLHAKKAVLLYNMADFLATDAQLQRALARTEQLWKNIREKDAVANHFVEKTTVNILADLYLKTKRYEAAATYAGKALEMAEDDPDHSQTRDIYRTLAESNGALGRYKEAYGYSLKYQQYSDSVYNYNKLEATREVEIKYENEKKERAMAELDRQHKTQRKINMVVIASLLLTGGLLLFVIRSKRLQKKLFLQQKQVERRELEKRVFEMEQTALRAQMNPHFIFNCLNSVQRYVAHNDAAGVNYYLGTFALLIRQTLENSGKPYISLKDEVDYLDTYLKLEQLRSNQHFEYAIHRVDTKGMENLCIPGMLIQPFVENSILHGMMQQPAGRGMITVQFQTGEHLVCTVEDNGPGLGAAGSALPGTDGREPMGTGITLKRVEALNQLQPEKIIVQMENGDKGAKITIRFPLITDHEN